MPGVGEAGEFELIGGQARAGYGSWLGQDQPDPACATIGELHQPATSLTGGLALVGPPSRKLTDPTYWNVEFSRSRVGGS